MLPSHPAQHQRSRLRCITPEGNCDMLAAVSLWYCGVIRSRICCVTTTDVGEMFALCHLLARQGHLAPARWYLWSFTEMEICRSSPKMRPPTLHLPELIEASNGHVCWNIKIFQKFLFFIYQTFTESRNNFTLVKNNFSRFKFSPSQFSR